ncbi:tetratricopeptide repeat protein [Thermodesulfobacteriota bacterium]
MNKGIVLIGMLGLSLILTPFVASAQSKKDAARLLSEAQKLSDHTSSHEDLERGVQKYRKALQVFESLDSEKDLVRTLNDLAGLYTRQGQHLKAIKSYEKSLAISKDLGDLRAEAATLLKLAEAVRLQALRFGSHLGPSEKYKESLAIYRKLGDRKGEAAALSKLGFGWETWIQYNKAADSFAIDRAVEHYKKALYVYGEQNDRNGIIATRNSLARVWEKALPIIEKSGNKSKEAGTLKRLAGNYHNRSNYDKAFELYEKALAIYRQLGKRFWEEQAQILMNLGLIYVERGQYETAINSYEDALALYSTPPLRPIEKDRKPRQHESASWVEKVLRPMRESILNKIAQAYLHLGKYDKAFTYYDQSLALGKKPNPAVHVTQLYGKFGTYVSKGQYDKAIEFCEQSLAGSRESADRQAEVRTLNDIALVYREWGQYGKAYESYRKALTICRESRDRQGEGRTLYNLGSLYELCGGYNRAFTFFEKALTIWKEAGDKHGEGSTLHSLGTLYRRWGHYDKAVTFFNAALAISRECEDHGLETPILNSLGHIYSALGQHEKAIKFYKKALAQRWEEGYRKAEGVMCDNLGQVLASTGNHEGALKMFERELEVFRAIGIPTDKPEDSIGQLYLDRGDIAKAESFIARTGHSRALGRLNLAKGNHRKAEELYSEDLESAKKERNTYVLLAAYTGLGKAAEGMQRYEKAKEYYSKAVKVTEDIRSSLQPSQRENFFHARVGGFYRKEPYEGLARVLKRLNKPVEAFKTSEYTKARVFAEAMSRSATTLSFDLPKEVSDRDDDLNRRLAALKNSLNRAYEKQNEIAVKTLEPQVKTLEKELQDHIKALRQNHRLFAATKYPEPMNIAQTALSEDEWTLSYDVTDPALLIYLTKGKRLVKSVYKDISRQDLDKLIATVRGPLSGVTRYNYHRKMKSFDVTSSRRLAELLLGDVLPHLPDSAPVIIVPDDALGVLPFEVLILGDDGIVNRGERGLYQVRANFFGDRNPISYYQSITALTLARTHARQESPQDRTLVVADPVYDEHDPRMTTSQGPKKTAARATVKDSKSPLVMAGFYKSMRESIFRMMGEPSSYRLAQTEQLAKYLKEIYPETTVYTGLNADKEIFVKEIAPHLHEYNNIVFGTHGHFGDGIKGIMEPMLILTLVPRERDGYLRMSEVMGLKTNANIVALTACQSGEGKMLSGEGTMCRISDCTDLNGMNFSE